MVDLSKIPGAPKPPVEITPEYQEAFIEKIKEKGEMNGKNLIKVTQDDKEYLTSAFETIVEYYENKGIAEEKPWPSMRHTPREMFDRCVAYMRLTLNANQPLTITGVGLFMGLHRKQIWVLLGDRDGTLKRWPEFEFLFDFSSFVELYNEYAAHKKMNPAGPIFILKNFGWKDKIEIEASTTQGALTDEEREAAQKRIANFSESG